MKKTLFFVLFLWGAVSFVSAAPAKITVRNDTGYDVVEVYVSPSSSEDWGHNYLEEQTLVDGENFTLSLPLPLAKQELYDFMFIDSDGDSYSQYDVSVQDNSVIVMTFEDYDDYDDYDESGEEYGD